MKKIKIVPLGGMGEVTQNMFLYQYDNEILIVDCGIGFPDIYMPGADIIIPDITYLLAQLEKGNKIVGMVLSHAHDDHIAALPYLLSELPDFTIYGSALTIGFAQERMKEGASQRTTQVVRDGQIVQLGRYFSFSTLAVTHSVPDAKHLIINTPDGVIYHGSDFKLDLHPVDGVLSDLETVARVGKEGVLLMLMDCLRVEREEWSKSESTTGPAIAKEIEGVKGKFIVTLMSSHIHRIQQVVDIAATNRRKVVFIGRSVEKNINVAERLGLLKIPTGVKINKKNVKNYRDDQLVVIIAGSQGQEGSSMMRAVFGEHRIIQINENDKVIISADAIPGNEVPYYRAIDELCRNKVEVIYPGIKPNIHHTGHAGVAEQKELLGTVKPKYVMPIGGADRHRELFRTRVAHSFGYDDQHVLIPDTGDVLVYENNHWHVGEQIKISPRIVDGLGIGDVGPAVLSDRRALSEAGIVVVIIPRRKKQFLFDEIEIVSRGFVFMKQATEVITYIQDSVIEIIEQNKEISDYDLKQKIETGLKKKLYSVIQREPLIVSEIMDRQ